MTKVSVCIPTYQQPEYFRRALSSVLNQSFTDFEVVVADDSQGTEIALVVDEMADSRVRYARNSVRRGSSANWNIATAAATGEYIKFLHHDDWLSSTHSLSRFVSLLEGSPDAIFAFSACNVHDGEGEFRRIHSPSPHVSRLRSDPRYLLLGNWIGAPSVTIYRRADFLRFDECLIWTVDIDFYLSILSRRSDFAFSDEPLVAVTDGAQHQVTRQVTRDPGLELAEWFRLYGKWAQRAPLRGERARFLDSLLARIDRYTWRDSRSLGLRGRAARLFVTASLLRRLGVLGRL